MDTRSAYIRRSRKGSRLNKRLAAAAVLGVAGCASLFAFALGETTPPAPVSPVPALATAAAAPVVLRTAVPADTAAAPVRRVYPYSIVPGGVHDSRELARVIATDKVVAAHYAGFDPAKFTVRTVDKPRAVYVSYRKGDKVYWTSKKLQLAKGETLLSDGTNEIRTRCGNRISSVRMLPVEASGPSAEELDSFVEQDDDGSVEETGFGTDTNPAGQGYQLHTFENGGVVMPASGSQPRSTSTFGARGPGFDGFGGGGVGGSPLYLTNNVDKDVPATNGGGGAGSGSGSSGSSGPGAGTGSGSGSKPGAGTPGTTETAAEPPTEVTGGNKPSGTTPPSTPPGKPDQPSGDPAPTTPSTPTIPDTLTPPTTDVPGKPGSPGTTPTKPTDVPEPGTPWLGAAGIVALLAARRGKKRD